MKLFVGNIPYSMSEAQLRELFERFGELVSCKLIIDPETKRSKGFGFVEFVSKDDAEEAMEQLNNSDVQGKKLVVNEARPQEKKNPNFRRTPSNKK